MSEEIIANLKIAAKKLSESTTEPEKIAQLTLAFDLFKKETEELAQSYKALSANFHVAAVKLTERNQELSKKVAQLDVVTRYLHNILNNISHGILFVDLNGIVTTYNGAAEAILEWDSLDVLYASFWDFFPDDLFGFSMGEALSTHQVPQTFFVTIESPSKQIRELELHISFVIQSEETATQNTEEADYIEVIQGIVIMMRDLTEINRLRRLASRNDRMKELGEIAASVAHEIRNPLGGIKGFASLLQRDLSHTPNLQQMADQIIQGAENLNRIVTNVLDYTRPLQLNRQPMDLIALIEELKHSLNAEQTASPMQIELQANEPAYIIPIDRQLIRSALLNLIVNANQAMPNGGTIKISIREELGQIIISISDTGIGIPKENLEKIFSPFFTTKAQGNGFGLSEVHKVVSAHEGTIDVFSEENVGTTFTIKLPSKTYARKKY